MFKDKNIENFIRESNLIEGITVYDDKKQYNLLCKFLDIDQITIEDILKLAISFHCSSYMSLGNIPELRDKKGLNVTVGYHRPPEGGKKIKELLIDFLVELNKQKISKNAYALHCEYESLHPLTDGNGRTGRFIWAWLMNKRIYNFKNGFLKEWYYQSLNNYRVYNE